MNLPPASSFFLIIFISLVINVPVCLGQQDDNLRKYTNCSRNFTCGDGTNIGYPFSGNSRPDYCGIPGYYLDCNNDGFTEIQIMSETYRVLAINPAKRTMTIARKDFMEDEDACPKGFANTTLNFTLFNYLPTGFVNLALSYGCAPIPSSGVIIPNKFNCQTNETSRSDAYYWSESLSGGVTPNPKACKENIEVPVMQTAISRLTSDPTSLPSVLREGFHVNYDVAASTSIASCKGCVESGGVCGYNNSTTVPSLACYCSNDPNQNQLVCSSAASGSRKPNTRKKLAIGIGFAVGAIMLTLFLLLMLKCCLRKTYPSEGSPLERFWQEENSKINNRNLEAFFRNCGSLAPNRFRYMDVKKMTNSFKEKLGQGGFGSVFKGQLRDGRLVAVKVLSKSKSNDGEEFLNEVASISRTSHVNIVSLLGFCFEKNKRALIYEFMPNGSLDKFIYSKNRLLQSGLEWETLYQVAIGIARGLEYLHRGCTTRILHFDIKPHNILLNEDLCPKISDFGLAKLCPGKESIISMLGARGTAGYIAPEVFNRNFGGVSHKSDVYSYGMMILEMVGGRKNIDVNVGVDHCSQLYFPHWIYDRLNLEEGLGLHGVTTDEREEAARKMTIVGLWCIQTNPLSRPSMSKVLEMLEGSVEALQIPPKPFLSSPPRSPPSPMGFSTISMS